MGTDLSGEALVSRFGRSRREPESSGGKVAKVAAGRNMLEAVFHVLRDGQAHFLIARSATEEQAA
jgi:hypothetical protein